MHGSPGQDSDSERTAIEVQQVNFAGVADMSLFTIPDLEWATSIVRTLMPPTPAYEWPLLSQRAGMQVVVKHENHSPTGSFKARGGLVYIEALRNSGSLPKGLVTATRGNHGQSVAIGASRCGIPALIVVPEGNSSEKNSAMEAFGGELVVSGKDFDESRVTAARIERDRGYHFIPSFHAKLVLGVATYANELFLSHGDLDVVYVPIGMGSGIAALISVRDLLGLKTEIVGVVAENAPAFALSFDAGRPISTETANTFADGMACRQPTSESLDIILEGAARVIRVSEDEIASAIRYIYTDTHNLAEGAGAASLAALLKDSDAVGYRKAGIVLSGGNIDMTVFAQIISGRTPEA